MSYEKRRWEKNCMTFDGFAMMMVIVSSSFQPSLLVKILSTIACHRRHNESDEQSGSYTMYSKYSHLKMALTTFMSICHTHIFYSHLLRSSTANAAPKAEDERTSQRKKIVNHFRCGNSRIFVASAKEQ